MLSFWHLTFTKIDTKTKKYDELLTVSARENDVKKMFSIAEFDCKSNADIHDALIDLKNEFGDIQESLRLSYPQMKNIVDLMGYELEEPPPSPPHLRLV